MIFSKSRKADLSLSINAIVILILAITMLALGLGFIKGMFGKVGTDVEQQISQEPEPVPATENLPITLSNENIIVNKGVTKVMKISVFCKIETGCISPGPSLTLLCSANPPTGAIADKSYTPPTFGLVNFRTSKTGLASFKAGNTANTYICTVGAQADQLELGVAHQAQFALIIR